MPGTIFVEQKGDTSCSSGSTITNTTECIAACTELGVGLGAGVESRLEDGLPCYITGRHNCRQGANRGARASLICITGI